MLVTGQRLTVPNPGPSPWFNPNAFAPSVRQYGNAPRNPLFGPGQHTFDISAMKNFRMPFHENQRLEFRAEFFNAFNVPQFSAPDANLGDVTFGQIQSTRIANREIQFALKYIF